MLIRIQVDVCRASERLSRRETIASGLESGSTREGGGSREESCHGAKRGMTYEGYFATLTVLTVREL